MGAYTDKKQYILVIAALAVMLSSCRDEIDPSLANTPFGIKGVTSVRVHKTKNKDITKTAGYKEAMEDVKHGRVTEYASLKDFYKEMGL
jgi:hypothetical protein